MKSSVPKPRLTFKRTISYNADGSAGGKARLDNPVETLEREISENDVNGSNDSRMVVASD